MDVYEVLPPAAVILAVLDQIIDDYILWLRVLGIRVCNIGETSEVQNNYTTYIRCDYIPHTLLHFLHS